MGCDIHGSIEIRRHEDSSWWATGRLLPLVGRSYDTFGCLFGVRAGHWEEPLFDDRGIPRDVARRTKERLERVDGLVGESIGCHSQTYFTVEELEAVDWSETSSGRDARFTILDENKEPTGSKFSWSSGWEDVIAENRDALAAGEAVPNHDGSNYIRRVRHERREALSGAWEWLLFTLLPTYGDQFAPGNVRVVVWFDN